MEILISYFNDVNRSIDKGDLNSAFQQARVINGVIQGQRDQGYFRESKNELIIINLAMSLRVELFTLVQEEKDGELHNTLDRMDYLRRIVRRLQTELELP